MLEREVVTPEEDSLNELLANMIANSFDSGEGVMLYMLDADYQGNRLDALQGQIRHCRDLDAVESLVARGVIEYPESIFAELIATAVADAESYGEKELEAALERPGTWASIPGFEILAHMHTAISEILCEGAGGQELVTLRSHIGAANPLIVARTPEWTIGIEADARHEFPIALIGTQKSLRAMLS